MPRRFKLARLSRITMAALATSLVACEDTQVAGPGPKIDKGPQSMLGKAKGFAEDTIADMEARQEAISRQADTVFDDEAARDFENSGDFPDGN